MINKKIDLLSFFVVISITLSISLSIILLFLINRNNNNELLKDSSKMFKLNDGYQNENYAAIQLNKKVNISEYSSSTKQYTVPANGYIILSSFATTRVGNISIYIDNELCTCNISSGNWVRDSIALPVSVDSTVYYIAAGENYTDGGIYFIPNK